MLLWCFENKKKGEKLKNKETKKQSIVTVIPRPFWPSLGDDKIIIKLFRNSLESVLGLNKARFDIFGAETRELGLTWSQGIHTELGPHITNYYISLTDVYLKKKTINMNISTTPYSQKYIWITWGIPGAVYYYYFLFASH